jgi:hypothetical protein
MQRYTVYFIWKLLYIFRLVPPPIITRSSNCIHSIWYLSDRYCYLSLAAGSPTAHATITAPIFKKHRSARQLPTKYLYKEYQQFQAKCWVVFTRSRITDRPTDICLQINVPTDATKFISLFLMFPLTLHVSGLYWPIIRGVLPYSKATSTDARTVNKHGKSQMVA